MNIGEEEETFEIVPAQEPVTTPVEEPVEEPVGAPS